MKILAFSDLHRDRGTARALVERAEDVDVVVGAGDFAVQRAGIDDVVEILSEISRPTVLVPGNGESDEELRIACREWDAAHVLHGAGVAIDGVEFFGIGAGIPVTPFGSWSFDLTEGEATTLLESCPKNAVLVSHSPPYGHVDLAGGAHLGSHAVLATVEQAEPRLVVCGHIHGCWGQRSTAGSTNILNAGPSGHILEA
jgi:Icc-related predicted phosphoesterase